jgi:aflatoxin B1 aldehyde reductase
MITTVQVRVVAIAKRQVDPVQRLAACGPYNPLAGGAFSKNFAGSAAVAAGSRFDSSTAQGKFYRDRYWNDAYFDALAEIHRSCEGHSLDAISVALRWLIRRAQ